MLHVDPMIIADMNRDWAKFKFVGVKVRYTHGSRSFGSKVKCQFFEILSLMGLKLDRYFHVDPMIADMSSQGHRVQMSNVCFSKSLVRWG